VAAHRDFKRRELSSQRQWYIRLVVLQTNKLWWQYSVLSLCDPWSLFRLIIIMSKMGQSVWNTDGCTSFIPPAYALTMMGAPDSDPPSPSGALDFGRAINGCGAVLVAGSPPTSRSLPYFRARQHRSINFAGFLWRLGSPHLAGGEHPRAYRSRSVDLPFLSHTAPPLNGKPRTT
jgi:hypothetical protein